MVDNYVGEIRTTGFNFAPQGWALCDGQLMSISQNTALFSLLGTMYGGNGQTTFALPNLQGQAAIAFGQGPGLSSYAQGEMDGVESVTLLTSEMPAHSHQVNAENDIGDQPGPANNFWAESANRNNEYSTTANTTMNPQAIGVVGGSQPHENRQPFLVVNFIIALTGIYPSRQ